MPQFQLSSPVARRFAAESTLLQTTLGALTEGGIIEFIEPIGAASILNLFAQDHLDIGISAWPFPLSEQRQEALEVLGYQALPGGKNIPCQRLRHIAGGHELHIFEAGSAGWTNALLQRDYLHQDEAQRQVYRQQRETWHAFPSAKRETIKEQFFANLQPCIEQWWIAQHAFDPVEAVVNELRDFPCLWCISSGWALDLFLERVTRIHHDVDVVIDRAQQLALQSYLGERGWKLVTPFEGRLEPWPPYMHLELPRSQVHAFRDGAFIDFLLTDFPGSSWQYRREPSILRSAGRMSLVSNSGAPILAPELVLLFKSRNTSGRERPQDQADFEQVAPQLEAERRAWLRWALTATQPEHAWIEQLA